MPKIASKVTFPPMAGTWCAGANNLKGACGERAIPSSTAAVPLLRNAAPTLTRPHEDACALHYFWNFLDTQHKAILLGKRVRERLKGGAGQGRAGQSGLGCCRGSLQIGLYSLGVGGEDNWARLLAGPGKGNDVFSAQGSHLTHSRVLNKMSLFEILNYFRCRLHSLKTQ